jgi:hypothetical protein
MSGLILRRVKGHLQARNAYRVLYDGIEIGSIGHQVGAHQREYWHWGIDAVLSRQPFKTDGEARDREDAMAQFRAVWEVFSSDAQRLAAFLAEKRKRI